MRLSGGASSVHGSALCHSHGHSLSRSLCVLCAWSIGPQKHASPPTETKHVQKCECHLVSARTKYIAGSRRVVLSGEGCGFRLFLLVPTGVTMPRKRGREAAEAEDETGQELRKTKSAVNEAFAELVCPITFSLPVDPVTAEDGNVYERSAIEEWLKQQHKSPVTNLEMGTRLLPALRVKNMIRAMVTSGALTGDKVDAWKLKLKEEEEVAEELRKAEAGDGAAMRRLGVWYEHGLEGLAKDLAKAFEWFKKSHEAGDAVGTGCLGWCYLVGKGVPKCQSRANTLMSQGAERGSKNACYNLGLAYAEGLWGFPKDETMARRYYSMAASASIKDCAAATEEAATWLRAHAAA
jgi:hypothetical protein